MRALVAGFVLTVASIPALAQGSITARVRVVDSLGAPIENVALSAVRGLRDVLASGVTDRSGYRTLTFPRSGGLSSFQIVARRLGYLPIMRLVPVDWRDSSATTLVLHRAPTQLEAVKITAEQSVKRNRTFVDAEAIAAFERPL